MSARIKPTIQPQLPMVKKVHHIPPLALEEASSQANSARSTKSNESADRNKRSSKKKSKDAKEELSQCDGKTKTGSNSQSPEEKPRKKSSSKRTAAAEVPPPPPIPAPPKRDKKADNKTRSSDTTAASTDMEKKKKKSKTSSDDKPSKKRGKSKDSGSDFTPRRKKEETEPAMDGFDVDPDAIRDNNANNSDSDVDAAEENTGGAFNIVEGEASPDSIQPADSGSSGLNQSQSDKENLAAVKIQSQVRKRQAKLKAERRRRELQELQAKRREEQNAEHNAEVRALKQQIAKDGAKQAVEAELGVGYEDSPENRKAAIKIQCAYRQKQARLLAQQKREMQKAAFDQEVKDSLQSPPS